MTAQLLEHPEASAEAVRRVGIDRQVERVRPGNELGQERSDLELELTRKRVLSERVAKDLHPRPERRGPPAFQAPAARDPDAKPARDAGELAHATGLADPGLAREKAQAPATVAGAMEGAEQALHRLGAPDERIARRRGDHRRDPGRRRRLGLEPQDLRRGRPRGRRLDLGHFGREAVPAAPDRLDRVLRVGPLAQRLARPADGPGHGRLVDVLAGPESLEQLLFADDAIVVLDQIADRVEDLRLQGHLAALTPELVAVRVELELPEQEVHFRTVAPYNLNGSAEKSFSVNEKHPHLPCRAQFAPHCRTLAKDLGSGGDALGDAQGVSRGSEPPMCGLCLTSDHHLPRDARPAGPYGEGAIRVRFGCEA